MRLSTRRPVDDDPIALRRLIAAGLVEVLDADPLAPVVVVRLAGADRYTRSDPATPPMLATLLASLHSRPGDTIATVGSDDGFNAICAGTGRYHQPLDPWSAGDHPVPASVALLVMRTDVRTVDELTLARHRRLLTPTGRLALAVFATDDDARIDLHAAGRTAVPRFGIRPRLRRPRPVARTVGQAMIAANHLSVHGNIAVLTHRSGNDSRGRNRVDPSRPL